MEKSQTVRQGRFGKLGKPVSAQMGSELGQRTAYEPENLMSLIQQWLLLRPQSLLTNPGILVGKSQNPLVLEESGRGNVRMPCGLYRNTVIIKMLRPLAVSLRLKKCP